MRATLLHYWVTAAGMAGLLATPCLAQSPDTLLRPGATIRVTVRPAIRYSGGQLPSARQFDARLMAASVDSVRFQPLDSPPPPVTLPWSAVHEIEVQGRRRSNALPGFVIGAGLGLIAAAMAESNCTDSYLGCGISYSIVPVFGAVGALIGALSHHNDWHRARLGQ